MDCTHDHDTLVLLYYGELTGSEEAEVRNRIATCASCQAAWQRLEADMNVIDGLLEPVRVDEMGMQRARASVLSAVRATRARPLHVVRWAASVAAAFLVFAAGWYLGAVDNENKWVDAVLFDANSQQVRIDYVGESESESSLAGSIHDAPMQRELGVILASDIDPVSRMRAARALASARIAPNVNVTTVLSDVLATDGNPVVRLQAVRALRGLFDQRPLPESVRAVLVERVDVDPNTAVRMKAMEILVASEQVSMDMQQTMQRVGSDERENPYIRFMAKRSLERLSGE